MRKICLALCLTLFTSLIHAAVMPIDWPAHPSHESVVMDISAHHCEDLSSAAEQKSFSNKSCHSYQCCLGLLLEQLPNIHLPALFVETLVPVYPSFLISLIETRIYKPPKIS